MSKIIIKKDNLYGVMDEFGDIIIETSYENIRPFSNGFSAVCKDGKWGYIDDKGSKVIDFLYEEAEDFSEHGVAAVRLNEYTNSWVLVRDNGELIKPKNGDKYYRISKFNSYGYAIVRTYSSYRIIDKEGNYANNEKYSSLAYIEDQDIFVGEKLGNLCIINTLGETVVDPKENYEEIYYPSNGLCQVLKDDKAGYINTDGDLVIPLNYRYCYEFSDNGLAYVEYEDGIGGYINKKDEFLIKPIFESGTDFKFGKAAVCKNGRYFFINEEGRKAIDYNFKYAGGFSNTGLAKVEFEDGRRGFINTDGNVQFILRGSWDADEFMDDKKITRLKSRGKVGLIDINGEVVLPPFYEDIEISRYANLHPFYRDGLWGYIDGKGNIVIDNIYEEASTFNENNMALVKFYIEEYDEVFEFHINDKAKMIDQQLINGFHMSFTNEYAKVYDFNQGLALAEKKEKRKLLSPKGQEIPYKDIDIRVKDNILEINLKSDGGVNNYIVS